MEKKTNPFGKGSASAKETVPLFCSKGSISPEESYLLDQAIITSESDHEPDQLRTMRRKIELIQRTDSHFRQEKLTPIYSPLAYEILRRVS